MFFSSLEMAPPDAILGLTEAFKKDTNPKKVNLGVGIYKTDDNTTPILTSVRRAREKFINKETTKAYLPIDGAPEYAVEVQKLLFSPGHEIVANQRAATAHTPGGTGALRVVGDFVHRMFPRASIWLSSPTWENHPNIFKAAGLTVKSYPYYDAANKCLDFANMISALNQVPQGDVVLFHACCHNPSGMDPNEEQWRQIARAAQARKFIPFLDFAYQGFADGIDQDAAGLRQFCQPGCELFVSSSFSKNFGLYNERVGAVTVVGADRQAREKAFSQIKICIRTNYSNPPAHGAAIVTTVLQDNELRSLWEQEVAEMRGRINGMRKLFADTLKAKGVAQDFSFITNQRGMFSFSGLNKDQVQKLKEKYAIYIVGSGRINVAGITAQNIGYLCESIADVL
ncbi:MAG: aspartate/tyrosine/aromatic aminotransferase [Deltaproteobacteria bacterium]|nr:aspartate/tyrosine/aromatic aminotransferase [Deltaproteobacteria bacterium]